MTSDGKAGWDDLWAEAQKAAGVCVGALEGAGFALSDRAEMKRALAELFLPALRPARRPEGSGKVGGEG